jgi:DNA primase
MMDLYQSARDEIKRTADIVEIIAQYVQLRKAGLHHVGLCPFHGDKDPSFTVNQSRQMFHCFGCKKGGDVFAFWMEYHKVSFPQAMRELAERYHIALPEKEITPAQKKEKESAEIIYEINEMAAGYFHGMLMKNEKGGPGREYLKKRALGNKIATEFMIGFAPDEWNGLTNYLRSKKADMGKAAEAGLIIPKEKGFYDRFRGRVIFPIHNLRKQVAGFGGRVTDKSLPKYLNSPETPVFHKGELLYGLHAAYQGIRESGRVVIVEGYTDVLALWKHGFYGAVATLGTALTKEHLRKLKGYANEAVVIFDADSAGKGATLKSLPLFLNEGMSARVVALPEGDDPDTFVNSNGLKGFVDFLERSVPIFEFYLDLKLSRTGGRIEDQVGILKDMLPMLSELNSESQQMLYVRQLAEKSRIPESIIQSELKKLAAPVMDDSLEKRLKNRLSGSRVPNLDEISILNLLAHSPGASVRLKDAGCRLLLSDPVIIEIFDTVSSASLAEGESTPEMVLESLASAAAGKMYREAVLSSPIYHEDVIDQALTEFSWKVKKIRLTESLKATSDDLEKKNRIVKQKGEADRAKIKAAKSGPAGMKTSGI